MPNDPRTVARLVAWTAALHAADPTRPLAEVHRAALRKLDEPDYGPSCDPDAVRARCARQMDALRAHGLERTREYRAIYRAACLL